ncbi:hypothetical protein B0T24DRAFT_508473, partial [Lasiosphaeria ovina]
FKTGAVFSEDYFTLDIKAVKKAAEIVDRFNQLNILSKEIKINVPDVWTFDKDLPAILSRTYEYGETDLGPEGISAFFSNHACSKYCRPHWTAPADPVEHYRPVSSTNMIRHTVSTAKSK